MESYRACRLSWQTELMSAASTFFNFAYGSNMLTRRVQERVSSARAVGVAALAGHELRWHKVGRDGSGKCDIVQTSTAQATVYGVVYEMRAVEKAALDKAEGLGSGYAEKQILLETGAGIFHAWVYYATNIDPTAVPFTWYKALVVAGAKQHLLPMEYISKLVAVAAKIDPDAERAKINWAIVDAG